MFGSRKQKHRAPAQPLTRETANPNAATAAASAFMRRDATPPTLSSAAAAAALRSRPTTPSSVADVQTKRTARRSPSVSSIGSRGSRPKPQRSSSVSSMTERTFRSPSPGRSPAPPRQVVPPVPSLPEPHQTANTLPQTQTFRTASQKLKDGNQGSWFGGPAAGDLSNVRRHDNAINSSPLQPRARPGSVSPSINFSYPRGNTQSPPPRARSMSASDQALVYDANSRRMVPRYELMGRESEPRFYEKPKKKKAFDLFRSGSHLSRGTVARTQAPALEHSPAPAPAATRAIASPVPAPSPVPEPAAVHREPEPAQEEPVAEDAEFESAADLMDEPTTDDREPVMLSSETTQIRPRKKRPSTVPEEPEPEDEEDEDDHLDLAPVEEDQVADSTALEAVPVVAAVTTTTTTTTTATESNTLAEPEQVPTQPSTIAETQQTPQPKAYDSLRRTRNESASPARSPGRNAHFATTPETALRHEPPPRSLSPLKSALKSPPRAMSPEAEPDLGIPPGPAIGGPEGESAAARKKRVRVSFTDQDMIIGEAAEPEAEATPVVPSPQVSKKPWHNIITKYGKKDTIVLDDQETMTPRPALPLFGSVREKKTKEVEERPLVRPTERAWSPAPALSSSSQPESATSPQEELGQSSDMAIGAMLAKESSSKNEANTSRFREPLPPVVTSMEGTGYESHSDLDFDNDSEDAEEEMKTPMDENFGAHDDVPTALPEEEDKTATSEAREEHELPSELAAPILSFTEATPPPESIDRRSEPEPQSESQIEPEVAIITKAPEEVKKPKTPTFGVPGGFPEDYDTDSPRNSPEMENSETMVSVLPPAEVIDMIKEATPPEAAVAGTEPPEPSLGDLNSQTVSTSMADIVEEEEDGTDANSIYSDAYEDLSEAEGDGFLSLDAILTTPVRAKVTQKLFETALAESKAESKESQTAQLMAAGSTEQAASAELSERFKASSKPEDDWENAKAYWRSLTTEKRRQLELEALEEAGEQADMEREQKEQKPKKKVKRRSASGPAVEAATAAPAVARHEENLRVYQIQPGTKWMEEDSQHAATAAVASTGSGKIRKSMRSSTNPTETATTATSQGQAGGLRKSLRAEPQRPATSAGSGGMRKSMRSDAPAANGASESRPSVIKTGRPASYHNSLSAEPQMGLQRNLSADGRRPTSSIITTPAIKPSLRRRGSDSSESSFTRTRASKGEGFFKTSMRGSMREPEASPEVSKGSGRFSLRSMSPASSTFRNSLNASPPPPLPTNSLTTGGKRTSMRSSMRSQSSEPSASRKRMSGLSFGSGKASASKHSSGSRFNNSSDDEGGPRGFSSRFAASSDEDEAPRPQSMGRGMASRTMRSGKSTRPSTATAAGARASRFRSESPEFPDAQDLMVRPQRASMPVTATEPRPGPGLQRSRSGRGTLVAAPPPGVIAVEGVGTARPTQQRRGSFMSSILRRKKEPATISREVNESAARRDTKLERSTEQLNMIRSNSNPRLQKRGPSWPLADDANNSAASQQAAAAAATAPPPLRPTVGSRRSTLERQRPSTAAGPTSVTAAQRNEMLLRDRSNSHGVASLQESSAPQKKKFGTLRKMFRLND